MYYKEHDPIATILYARERDIRTICFGQGILIGRRPTQASDNKLISDFGESLIIPETGVSRLHATITKQEQGFILEDQGSKNGTFYVKNNIYQKVKARDLKVGDSIRIGSAYIELISTAPLNTRDYRIIVVQNNDPKQLVTAKESIKNAARQGVNVGLELLLKADVGGLIQKLARLSVTEDTRNVTVHYIGDTRDGKINIGPEYPSVQDILLAMNQIGGDHQMIISSKQRTVSKKFSSRGIRRRYSQDDSIDRTPVFT